MSTVKAANLQNTGSGAPAFKNSSGTEIGQLTKAWVNINQSSGISIVDDFNVSSLTDTATGRFTVNFTTSFANANYVCAGTAGNATATTSSGRCINKDGQWTTGAAQLRCVDVVNAAARDDSYVGLIFIGD